MKVVAQEVEMLQILQFKKFKIAVILTRFTRLHTLPVYYNRTGEGLTQMLRQIFIVIQPSIVNR